MTNPDLTPSEARAVIRRHVHELRNMLNAMDLELACLLSEPAGAESGPALQKVRSHLILTEQIVRGLSVRFVEPSPGLAAAADLFHNWRQQLQRLGCAPAVHWEASSTEAAISVDFTAVVTVLCEICLQANLHDESSPLVAGVTDADGGVVYSVRQPASERAHQDAPPEAQQWAEWERMVAGSGGLLERTYDTPSAHSVTSLRFALTI